MSDSWPNVFWQPKIMAFMLVYVDDLKLVAKKGDHKVLWLKLKSVIDMGEEEPEARFLGCRYTFLFVQSVTGVGHLEATSYVPSTTPSYEGRLQWRNTELEH